MPLYLPGILATGGTMTGNFSVTGNEAISGTETITGNTALAANLLVGSTTALGDNGSGEIQLANATTVPTTNPTGGVSIYASGGGAFYRDPSGGVWPVPSPSTQGGDVTGAVTLTMPMSQAINQVATTSGTLTIQSCFLTAGTSVGHIGFVTGTTAATNPSHWWVAILDNTYKQQAHSADQLTGAVAASTWFSLAMTVPYVTTYTGQYYLAIMMANSAGANATLISGPVPAAAMVTGAGAVTPLVGGVSTGSLTGPGTDNSTVYAAPTAAANTVFMYAAA